MGWGGVGWVWWVGKVRVGWMGLDSTYDQNTWEL